MVNRRKGIVEVTFGTDSNGYPTVGSGGLTTELDFDAERDHEVGGSSRV